MIVFKKGSGCGTVDSETPMPEYPVRIQSSSTFNEQITVN